MLAILVIIVILALALFFIPPLRARLLEAVKELSDWLLLKFLLLTSRFEGELTEDGRAEQKLWRQQRLRNLRGLSLRSRQRFESSRE